MTNIDSDTKRQEVLPNPIREIEEDLRLYEARARSIKNGVPDYHQYYEAQIHPVTLVQLASLKDSDPVSYQALKDRLNRANELVIPYNVTLVTDEFNEQILFLPVHVAREEGPSWSSFYSSYDKKGFESKVAQVARYSERLGFYVDQMKDNPAFAKQVAEWAGAKQIIDSTVKLIEPMSADYSKEAFSDLPKPTPIILTSPGGETRLTVAFSKFHQDLGAQIAEFAKEVDLPVNEVRQLVARTNEK